MQKKLIIAVKMCMAISLLDLYYMGKKLFNVNTKKKRKQNEYSKEQSSKTDQIKNIK